MSIHIDISAPEKNYKKAQSLLTMQVAGDMEPFIPFQQGALRASLRFPDGLAGGVIEYATPYAHYQYIGEVYGPNIPRRDKAGNIIGWFSPPGKKKYPTGRPITYHTQGTGDQWLERAAAKNLSNWERVVGRALLG